MVKKEFVNIVKDKEKRKIGKGGEKECGSHGLWSLGTGGGVIGPGRKKNISTGKRRPQEWCFYFFQNYSRTQHGYSH